MHVNSIPTFLKHFRNLSLFTAWLSITSFPKQAHENWLIVQKAEQSFESNSLITAVLSIAGANITILSGTGP